MSRARRAARVGRHRVRRVLEPGTTTPADGERCELVATGLVNRICARSSATDPTTSCASRPRALRLWPDARAHVADRPQERRNRGRRASVVADRRVGGGRVGRRVRDRPVPDRAHRPARSTGCGSASATRRPGRSNCPSCATRSLRRSAPRSASSPTSSSCRTRSCCAWDRRTRSRESPDGDARPSCGGSGATTANRPRDRRGEISHDEINATSDRQPRPFADSASARQARVLWCSMLSEAGQFWPYVVRHDARRRAALVRRRDRG